MQINAHAVRQLAEICATKNARCIHISTDYVFDGEKTHALRRGRRRATDQHLWRIKAARRDRTAGRFRKASCRARRVGLRARPAELRRRDPEARAGIGAGSRRSATSFPLLVLRSISRGICGRSCGTSPTAGCFISATPAQRSWQQYGQFALDCAIAAGLPVKAKTVGALKLADMKAFVARRPINTVLSTDKLTRLTGDRPRTWQAAVEDYVANYFAR